MGSKTISIMKDVYELLRRRKRLEESFSDVIRRSLKRRDIMEFAGTWKALSDRDVPKIKNSIAKLRKRSTEQLLQET